MPPEIVFYAFLGLLGGITRALLKAHTWGELKRFVNVRDVVLGVIGGYVYGMMVLTWHAPDAVVTFFFSYAFTDIIDIVSKKVLGWAGVEAWRRS